MNKSDLIDKVSDTMGVVRRDGEAAVNAVVHAVMSEVKAGRKVAITGFGAFSPSHRKARVGRNPQTGQPVKVAASKSIRFAPGRVFKNVVNGRAPVPAPAKSAAKATTKKTAAKKAPAKRAPAGKVAPRKAAAKKTTTKRAPARKVPARKTTTRKTTTKRAPAPKTSARKAGSR